MDSQHPSEPSSDREQRPPVQPYQVWRWPLHWQILLGLLIGVALGFAAALPAIEEAEDTVRAEQADREPEDRLRGADLTAAIAAEAEQTVTARWDYLIYDLLGDLFMQGLMMIVVPLITSSIVLAIIGIGRRSGFGRLGIKTLLYYLATSLIAVLVGLVLINIVSPGLVPGDEPLLTAERAALFEREQAQMREQLDLEEDELPEGAEFLNVFRQMIPPNVVQAAAQGQLLGLIVVSLIVGFLIVRKLAEEPRRIMVNFWQAIYDITFTVTQFIIRLAPIGVCFLLATTVASNYARLAPDGRFAELVNALLWFTGTALAALAVHFLLVMPLLLLLVARVNPWRHYKAMAPALMTAFSTASSAATLPLTLRCVQENAGVSKKTSSFVLPLGATVNMDGTALYECVAAIFIAQAFGIVLGFDQQFFIVVVALLTSIGVAGVPAASLVAILVILAALEQQLAARGIVAPLVLGLPILFAFDRFLDMCRTAVNVFSDSVAAVVIGRTEGETGILEHPDNRELEA